jgi:hypothetical protein
MLIVWGKKTSRRRSGFIADFCPICRAVARYSVVDVSRVSHIYYIPVGRGEIVVHEITCETCKTPRAFLPRTISPEPATPDDLAEVAARTSPRGLENLLARVEIESRAPRNLAPDERTALLAEPFDSLHYALEIQRRRGSDQSISAIIAFLAIASGIAAAILLASCFDTRRPSASLIAWTIAACIGAVGFIAWAIYRAATDRRRIASSRHILIPLARSLRPLDPTLPELEQTIAAFRQKNSPLGKLDPIALQHAINAL